MTFMTYLVLTLIEHFKGQRSVYAVLHLLNGKRSSQTIQDGFLFAVHPFFGVLKSLSRSRIEAIYAALLQQGYVIQNEKDRVEVTARGQRALREHRDRFWLSPHLSGWYSDEIAQLFWQRLSLLVQSVSHLMYHDNRFIPVINAPAVHTWLKSFLHHYRREHLAKALLSELEQLCQRLDEREALLLVHKMSGKHLSGLTFLQLAEALAHDEAEMQINFQATLHHIVNELREQGELFPILKQLIVAADKKALTASTYQTLLLLKQGKTIPDIAKERRLKCSTIQDHIVEIAFFDPAFPVTQYVPKTTYEAICEALKHVKTRRLADIKRQLPDAIDYFHIRLVLTREKGGD
ncbi:hypothetical protein GCM10011391_16590 [Pullulanibacillus camelliae]|uniref:Helicase Helix-turn-helix domain-containing protein n=1 Tax=Pullulanibacillus camelliae TaxID=1707096 RepID=A0A8J2VMC8_9BACL|nr:helix-turn-helix domain-containing protein [Pullulanibacillus camelliae]GGE38458.1 hypothetical protein GCM10011391_16590 [Pullulanibacillus camelliae]